MHTVEIDPSTFAAARKLMACTELKSVRLTRCKVDVNLDHQPTEDAKVSLQLEAKPAGKKASDTELNLHFDFKLTSLTGDNEEKSLEFTLRLVALYSLPREQRPTATEIRAFAETNGLLNVWPYFREFVQSMSARAGLPPLTVPLFRIHYKSAPKAT